MYDRLNVYLDRSEEAVIVAPITADIWTYNDLADKAKSKYLPAPMHLTMAYCQLVDDAPTSLAVVRKWARDRQVIIEVADPVDPTQPETSED